MKKKLLAFLLFLGAFVAVNNNGMAQTRMIYFWDFNGYTTGTTYHLPSIPDVPADYHIGTAIAQMYWEPSTPVSGSYAGYSDISAAATADFDTVNQAPIPTFTVTAGNYFRARNPSDSMQMLFYIPSTNYQNITFRYGTETSSITSGDSAQIYSYSVDSGVTWSTAGLSSLATVLNTATWDTFRVTSVSITDPAAFNNPKLVFKITSLGRNHGTSGNNRFDNISVKGDTILPGGTLVHFWDFNAFSGTYANPNFPYINPDYTTLPTSNAYVHFGLFPGTSLSNPTYFDAVAVASASADYDTVNDYWPQVSSSVIPSVNGVRMRNPDDSTYLYYYIPSTGYKNINITYGCESSSYTSGDSINVFNYSLDSGLTWRLAGLSEALDSGSLTFRRIHVSITDPGANNNPTLFFRIHLLGRNTGTSGNNRFDNISIQGDTILSAPPTITTTAASYGPLCNTAPNIISVGFSTAGAVGSNYSVQITNANGTFPTNTTSNIIGTGTTSPITATIPGGTTPGTLYRVRVVCSYPGTYGSDNGSNITLAGVAGPISGPSAVCIGSNAALIESGTGTWTSGNTAVATVGSGTGIATGVAQGTALITYSVGPGCNAYETITVNPLPASIGGSPNVCIGSSTILSDGGSGLWSSSASGIATVGTTTGSVTGVAAGTATISFILTATGCYATQNVTVNALPVGITGTSTFCQGSTTTLNDATSGGSWSSSNTSIATVGTTGTVTGTGFGNPVITYTLPTGCIATLPVTVNPIPSPIAGGSNGCVGTTTDLTDATAFGEWVSSVPSVATIGSSTGVVTGVTLGTTVVSYILSTGCMITEIVSIHALPVGISGVSTLCAGTTTNLTDVTGGGTWSSSNTAIASVGTAGNVTTISGAGGNPVISYNLPTGCSSYLTLSVNPSPAAISGSTNMYCFGTTTTLSDGGSGTWSSSAPSIATIGSSTGIVTSVAAGATNITYTLPDGCNTSITETVNAGAAPITGSTNLCNGSSYNYTDETAFGVWTSSNSSVASIGSGDGIISATGVGSAIITYGLSSVCTTTSTITVSPLPEAISGVTSVCQGLSTALSDTGTGTWSASDGYLASVGATTGVVTGLVASELNITYTLPTGCATYTTFTVNPVPAAITGTTSVCVGLTTGLTETTSGGTWSSSNTTYATVGSTGIVGGLSAGNPTITYELPTGCLASIPVIVNPLPSNITGVRSVCMGLNTTLADASSGGSWTSSNTGLATVGAGSGVVSGVSSGNPLITYTLPTGCITTTTVTVNPSYPITGTTTFCTGLTNTLSDAVTGGTWTSSNTSVATIGLTTGIINSLILGNTVITYLNPSGCTQTESVTVISLPAPISGTTSICQGLTSALTDVGGGGWYSSNPSVASIGFGTGIVSAVSAGSATITYSLGTSCINTTEVVVNPLPNAISGIAPVCQSSSLSLSDMATGGTWYSSNTSIAAIGTSSGIVSGIAPGSTSITYTLPTGCITTNNITVNPIQPVMGSDNVCRGFSIALTDAVAGGSWSSSNTSIATVGTTGIVSALTAGPTSIVYTMPFTGCSASITVTVNPLAAITGTNNVCQGLNTDLGNINLGGVWTSSNTSISTVGSSTGVVTGMSAGVDTIVYTLPTGCSSSYAITVNPLPAAITGLNNLCTALSYTYSDTGSGTWSSSNTAIVSIGSASGLATTAATGIATITYTLPTGCLNTTVVTVNSTPEAITGLDAVCVGGTTSFSDTGSGVWSSSNASIASIGSGSGIATGISGGLAVISYVLPTGCLATDVLTVNPVSPITGTTTICAASIATLADIVSGGTWSSSDLAVATVVAGTGVVTGLTPGTATVAYTLITGCNTSTVVTVNPLPTVFNVSGGGSYCSADTGLDVYLSGSQSGVIYQLYDTTVVGSPVSGTGSVMTFGPHTAAGSYSISATEISDGCNIYMDGFATISIIPSVTPSVSLSNGIGDTVCQGSLITYVATPTNGGAAPQYLWYLNGVSAAVSVDVYNIFPTNGDTISVRLVSNALCANPDTITKSVVVTVDSTYTPSIYLTATPGVNIKPGESDTLKATTTGGGSEVTYQWYIDGSPISGATSTKYISSTLANGDTVTCIATGTKPCGMESSAYVVMNVSNLGVPNVTTGSNVSLFPNPNNGSFTLKGSLGNAADQEVSIEVTDMLGQVIYRTKVIAQSGIINQQIMLNNNLSSGVYMLDLKAGAENDVFHFVIGQ